jgi:hypothetical protein
MLISLRMAIPIVKTTPNDNMVRVNKKTYARLRKIKDLTGRKITEIVELAVQQVRVRGK